EDWLVFRLLQPHSRRAPGHCQHHGLQHRPGAGVAGGVAPQPVQEKQV
ncbi:MAG: Nicotinate-nucleotide adenylyltransferase, partial [uncultured Cytophagales bacterium]